VFRSRTVLNEGVGSSGLAPVTHSRCRRRAANLPKHNALGGHSGRFAKFRQTSESSPAASRHCRSAPRSRRHVWRRLSDFPASLPKNPKPLDAVKGAAKRSDEGRMGGQVGSGAKLRLDRKEVVDASCGNKCKDSDDDKLQSGPILRMEPAVSRRVAADAGLGKAGDGHVVALTLDLCDGQTRWA
jgi:hypothetical protein